MNAKERLRAYLEQRRELGESEMVLDALEVDDVMRMLGALQGGAAAGTPAAARAVTPAPVSSTAARAETRDPPATVEHAERARAADASSDATPPSDDWKEVMRTLKGASPAPKPTSAVPPVDAGTSSPSVTPQRAAGILRIEGIVVPLGLRVDRPAILTAGTEWATLSEVTAAIAVCKACDLFNTATQAVPGVGNPDADVMVVGEAPGEKEDLRGEPFVGPAGELLNKILGAIQLTRETVYISNVLKHRPPGNRNPMPDEVRACAPFLQRQIDLVQPKMILAFGTFAAQSLLGTKLAIGKLRQQIHWYQGIPLVATYHPAALLRNESWKRPTWEDVKLARRVLDATIRT